MGVVGALSKNVEDKRKLTKIHKYIKECEHSHGSHVVFRQERDLEDFGVGLHDFVAGGGDGLAGDAVDLVEGMWSQEAVVCGPDEQLQGERLALHVTVKLAREQRDPGKVATSCFMGSIFRQPCT